MSEKDYKIKCENLFKKNTVLLNQQKIDAEQIRALQKQNGELTDELTKKSDTNHQLVEQMAELNERCTELEEELTLINNECKDMREELKQRIRENQKLCEQIEKGKVVEHFEAYGQCRDSRRIAELERKLEQTEKDLADYQFNYPTIKELQKENAELKSGCGMCYRKDEEQLTKAKEIIKELMSFSVQLCDCRHTIDFEKTREEAEQFLKDSEVEK